VAISGAPFMMVFQRGSHNFMLMGLGFAAIALVPQVDLPSMTFSTTSQMQL
jgi:hypothetical protein